MKGLDGSPKMAKRNPMSYFTLHESPESIAKKISNAFTGGKPTVEEQKSLGGVPEICPIYDIERYHFVENDSDIVNVYNDCRCGNLLCGEHKAKTTEVVLKFVASHQQKRRKYLNQAREILQDTGP